MRVDFDNTVGLQFLEKEGKIEMQHYVFLIAKSDFDAFFARLRTAELPERSKPNEINHNYGGRGVYFEDPDGHYLEVITHLYVDR